MVKEIPILFSTLMVRAIMEDRKTQTRRIVKFPQQCPTHHISIGESDQGPVLGWANWQMGDFLYVRESYFQFGHWEKDDARRRKTGRQAWKFVADNDEIRYENNPPVSFKKGRHHKEDCSIPAWYKRLGRFMPKAAARVWLQVEEVKAERIQNISGDDALAEGIGKKFVSGARSMTSATIDKDHWERRQVTIFQALWQSINGENDWWDNPWVWVVKFRVLSKTGKPDLVNSQ